MRNARTDTDRLKLLRLGLDPGAKEGEVQGASSKFFRSLRHRGVTAQQIEQTLANANGEALGAAAEPKQSRPDYGKCTMPFRNSKHYGQMFMDIPPGALRSTLRWIEETPEKREKFRQLAFEITEFFKQAQS